jgi:hypothetical protein
MSHMERQVLEGRYIDRGKLDKLLVQKFGEDNFVVHVINQFSISRLHG